MLFASEKPTKKIPFGDDWVMIQHISKGVKDQYKARLASVSAKIQADKETYNQIKNGETEVVTETMAELVEQINELQCFLVAKSIKQWSSEQAVTEETVKALDESVFDEILKEVNEFNELTSLERKN